MVVTCISDSMRNLRPNPLAYNQDAVVHLTLATRYRACAMSVYAGSIMILVRDDTDLPNWYPVQLFTIDNPDLPSGWRFASYGESGHLRAIWGYAELVDDESHYDALLERHADALAVFRLQCERAE